MVAAGLVSFSLSHSCRLMKQRESETSWQKRLSAAPPGGYLAVDFVKLKHEGENIEGVDHQHTHEGIIWGHRFLTSAVVFTDDQDAYMVRADAAPTKRMTTQEQPYLKPAEAMLNVVGDVLVSGYDLRGVVVDAEFTSKLSLRSLPHFPVGVIGRFRSNTKVDYQNQTLKAKELAGQFPPGRARYYRKLRCYAKRLTVLLPDVGQLDLIIIWYPNGVGWKLSVLVSTIKAGVQELIRAFKARWGLEVMHRTLKQNLALAKCQCLAFVAQLRHVDFCISALHLMRLERQRRPELAWKQAQQRAARRAKDALLTELTQCPA